MGHEVWLLILAFLAEVVGTLAGFGSSTFFVPLAQYFEDFRTVLALTALLHVFGNLTKIYLFGRHADRRLALLFVLSGLATVVVGAWLTAHISLQWLEGAMGAFLVLYCLFFLYMPSIRLKPKVSNVLLTGAISGFATGLMGTGGAIRAAGLAAYSLNKNTFVATNALADFFTDAGRAVVYLSQGYLHREHWFYVPMLLAVAIAGSWVGKRLLAHVPEEKFRRLMLLLVIGIGISMVVRSVVGFS